MSYDPNRRSYAWNAEFSGLDDIWPLNFICTQHMLHLGLACRRVVGMGSPKGASQALAVDTLLFWPPLGLDNHHRSVSLLGGYLCGWRRILSNPVIRAMAQVDESHRSRGQDGDIHGPVNNQELYAATY